MLLAATATAAYPQSLEERLRGTSIEARATMPFKAQSSRGPYTNLLVRVMRVYISTKGRVFDYSTAGSIEESGRDNSAGGSQIVQFGDQFMQGKVAQQWDLARDGLIRTRTYPWGSQTFKLTLSPSLTTCRLSSGLRSTRPDGKFFFFDSRDDEPDEVLWKGPSGGSCRVMKGNVFAANPE